MQLLDAIIIGSGQCGLYAAKRLQEKKVNYLVLELGRIGQVWDQRLAGMRLFTSRQFCSLPEVPFEGDQNGFPDVKEMGSYLRIYANIFNLNIRENTEVVSIEKDNDLFVITLKNGEKLTAIAVINATGSNQITNIPDISHELSELVSQYTAQIPNLDSIEDNSSVAIIGDGASGRQIASALSARCKVTLATGSKRGLPPNKILGKDLFWWLSKLGILDASNSSLIAKVLKKRNPVPCGEHNNKLLKQRGITIKSKLISCEGEQLFFSDGVLDGVDVVIWATGYKDNTSWLKLPHCINEQGFVHNQGETPEPGLFIVGRKWFSCRASELVLGVAKDVDHVISKLETYMQKERMI